MSARISTNVRSRGSVGSLVKAAEDLKIRHISFEFPVLVNAKGRFYSKATPLTSWKFEDLFGLTYLAYRLDMPRAELLELTDPAALAARINNRAEELGMTERQYTIAIGDGQFRALMDVYNPLTAADIVKLVEEAGLTDVANGWLDAEEMAVNVQAETKAEGAVGVLIRNGFCGTVAFSFSGYFETGALQIAFPIRRNVRHQGTLADAVGNLSEMLEVVGEAHLIEQLEAIPTSDIMSTLEAIKPTKKSAEVLEAVRSTDNLFQALGEMGAWAQARGYASSVQRFVNAVIKNVPAAASLF